MNFGLILTGAVRGCLMTSWTKWANHWPRLTSKWIHIINCTENSKARFLLQNFFNFILWCSCMMLKYCLIFSFRVFRTTTQDSRPWLYVSPVISSCELLYNILYNGSSDLWKVLELYYRPYRWSVRPQNPDKYLELFHGKLSSGKSLKGCFNSLLHGFLWHFVSVRNFSEISISLDYPP